VDACPNPTFVSIDEDGALHLTWCFGGQGEDGSHRIMFVWDPDEGVMAAKIVVEGEVTCDMTRTAGLTLARLLTENLSHGRREKPDE
jgi:hypothetical protein